MSISTASSSSAVETAKQSLAALRAGHDDFAHLAAELFGDVDTLERQLAELRSQLAMQQRQLEEQRQLAEEQRNRSAVQNENDQSLQSRVDELEQDRLALEQELERVRSRAVEMAQTITDQKKQLAEQNNQWTVELRQLRRSLDKQAAWIAQQAELSSPESVAKNRHPAPHAMGQGAVAPAGPGRPVARNDRGAKPPPFAYGNDLEADSRDAVLGTVLSQFELLQKDVARRRTNSGGDSAPTNQPTAPGDGQINSTP